MKSRLLRPTPEEDEAIARGVARDPDAAPDLSSATPSIVRRVGRPSKQDPKISVTLRLDRDVVERFRSTGPGWQTRINAALREVAGIAGRKG
ncbi:MAG: BrnA antitoxin family protein [Roseiarcus sp.]